MNGAQLCKEWRAIHSDLLLPAFDGNAEELEQVWLAVASGKAELYEVERGGAVVAAFVVANAGCELEILAAGAVQPGGFVDVLLPEVEAEARRRGKLAVKANTYRPGLMRRMAAHGYNAIHVCMWRQI